MAEIHIVSVINKLRPRPERVDTWDIEDVGKELSKISSMDTGDAVNFIYKLSGILSNCMQEGIHVKLDKFCIVGISCDLDGNVKSTMQPASEIQKAAQASRVKLKNAENKGLDDEGYARKWLEQNPDDVVIMRDSSRRTRDDFGL